MNASTKALDDIVTILHLALVTAVVEAKEIGVKWFESAVDMAKQAGMNKHFLKADGLAAKVKRHRNAPTGVSGTTVGLDVRDSSLDTLEYNVLSHQAGVVESEISRSCEAETVEELEERRRLWSKPYIWDRHLALSFNKPLSINETDCQDIMLPTCDTEWECDSVLDLKISDLTDYQIRTLQIRPRGMPFACVGDNILATMLPLLGIIGQLIDLHHTQSTFSEQQREAFQTIYAEGARNQLIVVSSTVKNVSAPLRNRLPSIAASYYQQILGRYLTCIIHLLSALLESKWDMPAMLFDPGYLASANFGRSVYRVILDRGKMV